jgi:hypothetical protein
MIEIAAPLLDRAANAELRGLARLAAAQYVGAASA